jgi:hypothetical protein
VNQPGDIDAHNIFSLAHPDFYETLAHHRLSPEYVDRLKDLLPDAWILQRDDIWVHALCLTNKYATAAPVIQGFKIHVSSTPKHALRVLSLVVPVCVQEGINFKIAGDPRLLHLLNSKLQGRGYSGKFMTIYPPDSVSPTPEGFILEWTRPRGNPLSSKRAVLLLIAGLSANGLGTRSTC